MTENGATQPLLVADHVGRMFHLEGEEVHAVRDISITVNRGRFVAIVGRSGSGKTTLLNLLAGLDTPTSGQVRFEGRDVVEMGEKEMTELRRHRIGIVFQSFGLLPLLSAFENVELPLRIAGVGARTRNERAAEVLDLVGLLPRSRHRPFELSGGEQQRVAIARAVVMRPSVILADEPTGELDSANAQSIFGLFSQMAGAEEMAIVTTTHDQTLLDMAEEVYEIGDGLLLDGDASAPSEPEDSPNAEVDSPPETVRSPVPPDPGDDSIFRRLD
ncbi:MAG TPA: ABC transporter ATP-binding protein [Dehalococcoidia bacterium]|jgi:putative ABC transport system ATP-binding protein|nr:macrolide ABC transporter ATP-binding protein [Chloroflexota bacterium]MDP5877205.1 ABC transporter ATP-binding protein [Dehalococcoidia bacterium]MDP7159865.1 ABC transporter ATP-binding protein [Dehalococcoidia bacterium]MDP7212519.1 ABC transporter ATP-binding protein [Dehalococcoidia bacterium]MDP7513688.1 ABC transporter ATP-binding protein [Dehalococcoidia bacterium]|tara:strand:+ start:3103 stop:3921 length:819 start_codon:yes stop_codon:yes gene_type:complete